MRGPEHWREAERLLAVGVGDRGSEMDRICTAAAQVHATMALAAVTALAEANRYGFGSGREWDEWYRAITSQPPADGVTP